MEARTTDDPFAQLNRIRLEGGDEVYSRPQHLQGVCAFEGRGLEAPFPLCETLSWTVPAGRRGQLIYFRAGNSSPELISLALMRDGELMRLFPIGARSAAHVPLAVVEDILPGTRLEVYVAAPEGVSGHAVVDVGLLEI
jgi:assimilatory nitrate reductase catalytic subunit